VTDVKERQYGSASDSRHPASSATDRPRSAPVAGTGAQTRPKLSVAVVMPVRNEADQVDVTLESLWRQHRLPDEIVVADGGSTDQTVERVKRHGDRGVPIRVVDNATHFCGGGRNAGVLATRAHVIVHMDFGNVADPGWLAAMVEPFESDPELDYLGGIYHPKCDTKFERVVAAVVNFNDCIAATWPIERLREFVAGLERAPLPGGMCMAYRRALWEQAGGFSTWARKGQDRLFGLRVRRLGRKIGLTAEAIVHYNTADSYRALYRQRFLSGLWGARTALPRPRFRRLAIGYAALAGALLAACVWPTFLPAPFIAYAGYGYWNGWRKLDRLAAVTGERFTPGDRLTSLAVLFVRDAGVLLGNLLGELDRLVRPRWRRMTREYLERGEL